MWTELTTALYDAIFDRHVTEQVVKEFRQEAASHAFQWAKQPPNYPLL